MDDDTTIIYAKLPAGKFLPLKAWRTDVPGLVVTNFADTVEVNKDAYVPTHELTGIGLVADFPFNSLIVARMFCEEIRDLMNWELPGEQWLQQLEKMGRDKMRAVLRSAAEEFVAKVEANPMQYLTFSEG